MRFITPVLFFLLLLFPFSSCHPIKSPLIRQLTYILSLLPHITHISSESRQELEKHRIKLTAIVEDATRLENALNSLDNKQLTKNTINGEEINAYLASLRNTYPQLRLHTRTNKGSDNVPIAPDNPRIIKSKTVHDFRPAAISAATLENLQKWASRVTINSPLTDSNPSSVSSDPNSPGIFFTAPKIASTPSKSTQLN